jgi:cytochrome d ubiquinol oxidase subunit II
MVGIYSIVSGCLLVLLHVVQGGLWLGLTCREKLAKRALWITRKVWPVLMVVTVLFLLRTEYSTYVYDNYVANPLLFVFFVVPVAALFGIRISMAGGRLTRAGVLAAGFAASLVVFVAVGLFPTVLPSAVGDDHNLDVYECAAPRRVLTVVLCLAVPLTPLLLVRHGRRLRGMLS